MTEARKTRMEEVIAKRQFDLGILLENVNDPHNVAAVMRSCDAVGVQSVYVLNTTTPRFKKSWAQKTSSSASKWLDVYTFDDMQTCVRALRERYGRIYATHLTAEAKPLHQMDFTQSLAVAFGNEHSGISEALQRQVDGHIIIPQVGIVQSLNISVACAVVLYEAFRQKEHAHHYRSNDRFLEEKKILYQQWGIE